MKEKEKISDICFPPGTPINESHSSKKEKIYTKTQQKTPTKNAEFRTSTHLELEITEFNLTEGKNMKKQNQIKNLHKFKSLANTNLITMKDLENDSFEVYNPYLS